MVRTRLWNTLRPGRKAVVQATAPVTGLLGIWVFPTLMSKTPFAAQLSKTAGRPDSSVMMSVAAINCPVRAVDSFTLRVTDQPGAVVVIDVDPAAAAAIVPVVTSTMRAADVAASPVPMRRTVRSVFVVAGPLALSARTLHDVVPVGCNPRYLPPSRDPHPRPYVPTLPFALVEGGILVGVPASVFGLLLVALWSVGRFVRRRL